jgi:hypothetical protein
MGKRVHKRPAAYASAAEASVTEAEPSVAEQGKPNLLEDKWAKLQTTVGYCGLCKGVKRDFKKGHSSRRPNCKAHPDSRNLNEEELAVLRKELEEEFADPQHAREKKVAAAKERHAQLWKPPVEEHAVLAVYKMNFGKHKGKTIQAVLESDKGYFMALASWKNNIFEERPDLKAALDEEGYLQGLLDGRPRLQVERAHKVLQKIDEETQEGKELHPEVKKLRRLQQIEASSVLDGIDRADALAIVHAPPKPKRKYSPTARVLLPQCSICGAIDHKRQSCPNKNVHGVGIPDMSAAAISYMRNKRMAKLVARLKYTQIQLRTESYESKASKMARAPLARDFLSLSRASPRELAMILLDDKLLEDLNGVPCPRKKCQDSDCQGYLSSTKTLGSLRTSKDKGQDINSKTVWHACDVCNVHQSVALYNPIFAGFVGKTSRGVSIAVLAFWNALEGVPQTVTVRQLNIGEQLCQHLYFRANAIMAFGAHRLQSELVWGTGGDATVECEIDCTVICKWKQEEDGHMVYYYYVYMGARQRGSALHFAIAPAGISRSVDEGRVNPESSAQFHAFCRSVFGTARRPHLISMTDGAVAYQCRCEECQFWFVQHFSVNHSQKPFPEFSRVVQDVIANVQTGATRDGKAGTNTLDPEWGFLKAPLPRNLSARTAGGRERCDVLVRASQFRRMLSGQDRWPYFCKYAHEWMQQRHRAVEATKGKVREFARKLAAKRDASNPEAQGSGAGDAQVVFTAGEARGLEAVLASDDVGVLANQHDVETASEALQRREHAGPSLDQVASSNSPPPHDPL